jgi:uncharacterized protein YbjT (DUF2867 family)
MKQHKVKRIVLITAFGIGDSRDQIPAFARLLGSLLLRGYTAEKESQERIVRESGLDWTVVRPYQIADGPRTGNYSVGINPPALKPVTRADLADFLLKQLTDATFVRQTPAIVGI